jgi:hypothetical protein
MDEVARVTGDTLNIIALQHAAFPPFLPTYTHTHRITFNVLLSLLEADILLHTPGLQSLCQHTPHMPARHFCNP